MIKKDPKGIFAEFENGKAYKQSIDLYEKVKLNENFYLGRHWEGLNAPDLDKPVVNIVRRVVTYQVAMIVSDDVGVSVEPMDFGLDGDVVNRAVLRYIDRIKEENSLADTNRLCVRNASVDGDACLHVYFDPDVETGEPGAWGGIRCEVIENLNVFFGNPQVHDKERQPYIILSARRLRDSVEREMRENGRKQDEIDRISTSYESSYYRDSGSMDDKVTVLTKYWKENGSVWMMKCTENAVVKEPVDTELRLYPIAYMSWELVKDSYHGEAALTNMIPNQIFINKTLAMAMKSLKDNAFPRIVYDMAKFPDGFSNRLGAVGANGDPNQALYSIRSGGDMSPQVIQLVNMMSAMTRDTMGASDAALGNVRPENTSAIIAVQQSTAVPLELSRREYYRFVEDYIRIFIDMMACYYGTRIVAMEEVEASDPFTRMPVKTQQPVEFDFSSLRGRQLSLKVNIGESTYWSELMQMQTLENLRGSGMIDTVTYLEEMPQKYIRNKDKLIKAAKSKMEEINGQIAEIKGQMTDNGLQMEEAGGEFFG